MTAPSKAARVGILLKRVVAGLAISAFAFLIAFALGEVVIRLAAPQQLILVRPDLWQPADSVGYLRRADVHVPMNTGERSVTVHTDRDGFRVGESGRQEAALDVLLLGDSFMEALQVEHEQSTAHQLERLLVERVGAPVVVRNSGVGGWDPNHYLIQSRRLAARDTFSLVVVAVFVGNDAVPWRTDRIAPRAPVQRNRFRLPRSLAPKEFVQSFLAPVNDILEERSHLFILLKTQSARLRMRLGLTASYFPVEYMRSEASAPRWGVTTAILKDLDTESRARGMPVMFVLVPEQFQVYAAAFEQYVRGFGIDSTAVDLDQPTRLLGEHLRGAGLTVVDALPAFRQAAPNSPPLFGRIDAHLSAEGHALLASVIADSAAARLKR